MVVMFKQQIIDEPVEPHRSLSKNCKILIRGAREIK